LAILDSVRSPSAAVIPQLSAPPSSHSGASALTVRERRARAPTRGGCAGRRRRTERARRRRKEEDGAGEAPGDGGGRSGRGAGGWRRVRAEEERWRRSQAKEGPSEGGGRRRGRAEDAPAGGAPAAQEEVGAAESISLFSNRLVRLAYRISGEKEGKGFGMKRAVGRSEAKSVRLGGESAVEDPESALVKWCYINSTRLTISIFQIDSHNDIKKSALFQHILHKSNKTSEVP